MVNVFMLNNYVMTDVYIWIGFELLALTCEKIWIAPIECIKKMCLIHWIMAATD